MSPYLPTVNDQYGDVADGDPVTLSHVIRMHARHFVPGARVSSQAGGALVVKTVRTLFPDPVTSPRYDPVHFTSLVLK